MATSFSVKRTAVHLSTRHFEFLIGALLGITTPLRAEGLFESLRVGGNEQPGGYVFVSESVSDTALIPLARDASAAGFTLVINGFWGDLAATRQRVARINEACCGQTGARWQINPMLFQRYQVTAVPSFVISVGPTGAPNDFSKISGEMGVANALKFFSRQSSVPAVRQAAQIAYKRAFATQ